MVSIVERERMVKHFDTGKFDLMPVSGRHTITACGLWLQDNHKKNEDRKTKTIESVTCKKCIKILEKEGKL